MFPSLPAPQSSLISVLGFQISLCIYCDRIKKLLQHMQDMAESSLPANRVPVSSFLASQSVINVERVLAGISKGQSDLKWEDISDSNLMDIVHARNRSEEERMGEKLKELNWYVDESNTLLLIIGAGRVEMVGIFYTVNNLHNLLTRGTHTQHLMTLLYLLVKRHCLVVQFAQTNVIDMNEFLVAERSLDNVWIVVQDRLDGLKGTAPYRLHDTHLVY